MTCRYDERKTVVMSNISHYDEDVPVLIVGGSLVGLSMALFLAWRGVPCMLILLANPQQWHHS
jgi:FAD binding domain